MIYEEFVHELSMAKPQLYPFVAALIAAMLESPGRPPEEIIAEVRREYGV